MIPYTIPYDAQNWFWIVGGDTSKAWSSAAGAYVTAYDQDRTTQIASESDLTDVLRPYGLMLPAPTQQDYAAAVQAWVDKVAVARGYESGVLLASYTTSTVSAWAQDAASFIPWRDNVWTFVFQTQANVAAGTAPQPTISQLVASLPASPWPA